MSKQGRLALYCCSLPVPAVAALWWLRDSYAVWPSPLQWALAVCALLIVWHFGLPAAVGGLRSMERVPQIALLLVGGPVPAALQCALAAVAFPFTHAAYRQNSWRIAALRALNNMSMLSLMMVAGWLAFDALGGHLPLEVPGWGDLLPLIGMIVSMQSVNIVMLVGYHAASGRPIAKNPSALIDDADLLFAPLGVLAAMVWLHLNTLAMLLMAGFVGIFLVSHRASGGLRAKAVASATAKRSAGLSGAQRLDRLAEQVLTEVRETFVFDEFMFGVLDRKLDQLDFRVRLNGPERLPRLLRPRDQGLFGWVAANGRSLLVEDFSKASPALRERTQILGQEPGSMLIAPIMDHEEVVGIISVQHFKASQYRDHDLTLLEAMAHRLARGVADARAFEELDDLRLDLENKVRERTRELSELVRERDRLLNELREKNRALDRLTREDPLTELANRREFDHALTREIAAATRQEHSLCLALIDLDQFKQINDRFGHAVGDQVLTQAAEVFRAHFRGSDLVARVGGEEFAVLLPDCTLDDARQRCESLRTAYAAHDWRSIESELQSTLSGGLVLWRGETGSRLLARVDSLLYAAKQEGRNRIVTEPAEAPDSTRERPVDAEASMSDAHSPASGD